MPKLTLVLGRKAMQAFDIEAPTIRIGREPGLEIVIDNPSVSREQAEIRLQGDGSWIVADLGSANGTFLNGKRIGSGHPLKAGDEIGIGKYSLLFEKEVEIAAPTAQPKSRTSAPDAAYSGTMQIKASEVEHLLQSSSKERQAHLTWEAGGQRGTHYLTDAPAVLIGMDDLCDVRVPKGPKHHMLVIRTGRGCEVRNLAMFGKMKVRGNVTRKTQLKDGDVVEMSGLKVTFVGDLG